jgi:hypothetical protein
MKLILIELNEINFDTARFYLDNSISLPGFKKIIDDGLVITEAESKYDFLEPWIQWPSVHCGKTVREHQIFRLGDIVNSNEEQFFEKVEAAGFSVGAISPMNASNRLHNPAYFIPDPWTQTPSDGSFFSKHITSAVSQAVNDNSQSKLTMSTLLSLVLTFFALVSPLRYLPMMKYALGVFAKPWRKALFLDMLLYEIHKTLFKRKSPNFSTLFLNAGAHIQHHYFFNSPFLDSQELQNPSWYIDDREDPVLEMLKVYDEMLLNLIYLPNTEIIVATGLSQKPYEQLKFYYRLKDHNGFLKAVGIEFQTVVPRMTRDFLIMFDSEEAAIVAEKKLSSILVNDDVILFEEIDNRGKDIFVVLTYSFEITKETMISISGNNFSLSDMVAFVAIKNGEHQSKGFAYFSEGLRKLAPSQGSHVSEIHNTVLRFFGMPR